MIPASSMCFAVTSLLSTIITHQIRHLASGIWIHRNVQVTVYEISLLKSSLAIMIWKEKCYYIEHDNHLLIWATWASQSVNLFLCSRACWCSCTWGIFHSELHFNSLRVLDLTCVGSCELWRSWRNSWNGSWQTISKSTQAEIYSRKIIPFRRTEDGVPIGSRPVLLPVAFFHCFLKRLSFCLFPFI